MKPIYSTLRVLAVAAAVAPVFAMAQVAAPVPPEIAARNYLLVDVTAGQVLGAKDVDAPVEQASLTKLMSAYVVFDALRSKKITLEQRMPVSERAWKMPGSRMFIDPKMQVPVNDLLSGMIIQSGNDATMALAEAVGGTAENFVKMMNDQAKALGMKNTSYKNPEGLTEPGHLTTARDLSILAQRLMHDFPEYMHYYATKQYSYPGTPASNGSNRNALLFRDPTVDGLKTGHTNAAGYCLVATAKRDLPNVGQRRLLSIVLGTASEKARANESQKLLNWGYTAFDAVKLFDSDQPVATPAVWKGAANAVKIGKADGAVVVTVPSGTGGKLTTEVVRQDPLIAPIAKGQSMGVLKVKSGADVVAEVPLVALEAVEQAGFFGRLWDTIRLWIK
ncbi:MULTISPECIES: D-alanyl-D-alanine carboxypeptidase family protein [Comamonas]|uniref:serine-type D-Ala-D-Ala carboxypeptidase n=1 Tax=Comamonas thiooxydans TaxID=363952 RepID=A0A096CEA3_9BURK|nr:MULTISPECIES: D-alanyl-D-alanine carboxypeptidase family protein [Comamonas]EFI62355.1 serine-type D-Ala-D-Ala carboxypeptidase [Comamonas thiooxydans]KGG89676.1 cytochrome C550 [Comamonas thiooxydans]KGG91730.1 cytochrome C550 [Comamonas thiooxydans]KGH02499.1 cytochrome C550 [Comamonas thiooxydans]KGH03185.1 cytochrome C550 [Comamonas thiooxydans]